MLFISRGMRRANAGVQVMGNKQSVDYTFGKVIGHGGNGVVQEVLYRGQPTHYCAKRLHPNVDIALVRHEADIASAVEHRAILPCWLDTETFGEPVLVMYQAAHSLADRMERARADQRMRLSGVLEQFVELADALSAAHLRGVLHRDIKPANILFYDGRFCLADWGWAKLIDSSTNSANAGTPMFRAPEVSSGHYKAPADIYSFGLTLRYALEFSGSEPNVSDHLRDLVTEMTDEDPSLRPTARQVVVRLHRMLQHCEHARVGLVRAREAELAALDEQIRASQATLHELLARRAAAVGAQDDEEVSTVLAFEDLKSESQPTMENAAAAAAAYALRFVRAVRMVPFLLRGCSPLIVLLFFFSSRCVVGSRLSIFLAHTSLFPRSLLVVSLAGLWLVSPR